MCVCVCVCVVDIVDRALKIYLRKILKHCHSLLCTHAIQHIIIEL